MKSPAPRPPVFWQLVMFNLLMWLLVVPLRLAGVF